ncbi:MAG: biotin transporter BioY [Clostridia bacterium]|nr:biotin transporter BioY [Clostridia bacterium]
MRKPDARSIAYTALCTVLIAICSWISVPAQVPFTLQTFAVFLTSDLLGPAAILSVLLYLLLGAIGIPVFAGFSGGISVLLGPTGGYLIGFIAIALLMSGWCRLFGEHLKSAGMLLGLLICYLFGTLWFVWVYTRGGNTVSFTVALGWCVLPYVIPDLLKIALARFIAARLRPALKGVLHP